MNFARFCQASPAYPAAIILFGMTFGFAATYFLAIPWAQWMTGMLYTLPLIWIAALMWRGRATLPPPNRIDCLFAAFMALILASLLFHGGANDLSWKAPLYLPFMVLSPYLCGRMMKPQDLAILAKLTIYLGLILLPWLPINYFFLQSGNQIRFAFFGQDHSPLLIAMLLTVGLLALCARKADTRGLSLNTASVYGSIGVIAFSLIFISARGWVVSAVMGLGVLILCTQKWKNFPNTHSRKSLFALAIMLLTLGIIPQNLRDFYGQIVAIPTIPRSAIGSILGEESCQPIQQGINSVAIRTVLYREAIAMFLQHPILGVGANRFGEGSCAGLGTFPHSTILQAFAELGIAGGLLLLSILSLAAWEFKRHLPKHKTQDVLSVAPFACALFATFLTVEQLHGSYFASSGVPFMLGIAAHWSVHRQQKLHHPHE